MQDSNYLESARAALQFVATRAARGQIGVPSMNALGDALRALRAIRAGMARDEEEEYQLLGRAAEEVLRAKVRAGPRVVRRAARRALRWLDAADAARKTPPTSV